MEGYLPVGHAAAWTAVSAPAVYAGLRRVQRVVDERPEVKLLFAAAAAFAFVLSALKLPSFTGTCSHPTGMGLGTVLFGPVPMALVGFIVLLFQALLLAHGGLTTLGANLFSMAIIGPWAAWLAFRWLRGARDANPRRFAVAAFAAGAVANLVGYASTAVQLALAHPDPASGVVGSMVKFGSIFAVTQIPLAISEGLLTVLVLNLLRTHGRAELRAMRLLPSDATEDAHAVA